MAKSGIRSENRKHVQFVQKVVDSIDEGVPVMTYYILAYAACAATIILAVLAGKRNLAGSEERRPRWLALASVPISNSAARRQRFSADLALLRLALRDLALLGMGLGEDRKARLEAAEAARVWFLKRLNWIISEVSNAPKQHVPT